MCSASKCTSLSVFNGDGGGTNTRSFRQLLSTTMNMKIKKKKRKKKKNTIFVRKELIDDGDGGGHVAK